MEHYVEIDAPVHEVWVQLQDANTWNGLSGISNVTNVAMNEGTLMGFDFSAMIAGSARPGKAVVKRTHADKHLAVAVEHNDMDLRIVMGLEPIETGTKLGIGLEAEPKSFMVKMAWGAIIDGVERGFLGEVESFARRMEKAIEAAK